MNYERIIDVVKEELSKESAIREEVIFKKGYAEGYKDAENNIVKTQNTVKEEHLEINEEYADGYADALQDAWEALKYVIFEQSAEERESMFGTKSIVKIVNEYSALDVMKILLFDAIEEKEREENINESIGEILDSDISDEAKRAILNIIDSFGDDVDEIRVIKLKDK